MMDQINHLLGKSHDNYVGLTRLLLGLSVGFVAITTAVGVSELDEDYYFGKVVVGLYCVSVLFGLWLQIYFIKIPLTNIKKYVKHIEEQRSLGKSDEYWPKPPFMQKVLFISQISTFVIAFFMATINILLFT